MKRYGLVGYPLGHSFSKRFFSEKFKKLGLTDTHKYDLFELEYLKDFPAIWERNSDLEGVNVTIPHKINIIPFLDQLDASVHKVEAVNVVKKKNGKLVGYNADYIGFKKSLKNWLPDYDGSALILGSGGSSKAVQIALDELSIPYEIVSRFKDKGEHLYTHLIKDPVIMEENNLIINTTPIGLFPDVNDGPPIPYDQITDQHYLYDLIYNPEVTYFMRVGGEQGAKAKNGIEMLELQAERTWEIWNSIDM
ncbi:MAG: shikimate dehydrogenase [Cyclobacteriaceae bacterium]|nr:shikimate dehydrogenase [Cyclobacteriaceae bacterium HetDA_MAG_MS6]